MALVETIHDDFADGARAAIWNLGCVIAAGNTVGTTIAESGGVLSVTAPENTTGVHYNGYTTATTYDLTNSGIICSVPQTCDANGSEQILDVAIDANNWIRFDYQGGNLSLQTSIAGTTTLNTSIAYNATNHRWWRIRHGTGLSGGGSGDNIYLDTAPDSGSGAPGSWTQQATAARPFVITALIAEICVGTFAATIGVSAGQFDNVNPVVGQVSHVTSIIANASTWTDQVGSSVSADLVTALDDSTATYIKSPGNPAGSGPITIHTGPLSKPNTGDRNFVVGLQKSANTGTMDYTVECKKSGGASVQTFNKDASAGATLVAALGNVASTGGTATCTVTNAIADGDWANGFDWIVTPLKSA